MDAVRDRERTLGADEWRTAAEAGNVRPMLEVVWEGALKVRCFSPRTHHGPLPWTPHGPPTDPLTI